MRYKPDTTAIVTGGLGFIGSHFIEKVLKEGWKVINIDKITYASNSNLPFENHQNYSYIRDDISSLNDIPFCDIIINFAAESHVDNSIQGSECFINSNFLGVFNLLEILRKKIISNENKCWKCNPPAFFQISTDEIFGDTFEKGFDEYSRFNPSNPYSASKAAAECLLQAWSRTYGIQFFISRTTNNYGPRQHSEKLIPMIITKCLKNEKITIHGNGQYLRNWIHVKDNVDAIWTILQQGSTNELYNIASPEEFSVKEIATKILAHFNKEYNLESIDTSMDRTGCDLRYALKTEKISQLGWKCKRSLAEELSAMIEYYTKGSE